jgi:tetratricopeptide (TPR) repeat protein
MADIYVAEGKASEALEARAAEQKLGPPDCVTEKLQCDFASGRFDDVVKAAKAKNAPEGLYWLARAYYELALQSFEELNHLPESAELHRAKAEVLRDERKYRESVEEWRAALRFSPGDRSLRRELAATLYFSQDYRAILPELQQLLKADPDSANLNFFVGDSLLETEQNENAVPYLETALRLDPKLLPAHVALGMCYVRLDNAQKAIPHLKAGLELDKSGRLYYLLARAYKKTGQLELAKTMMDEYQQLQKASAAK